MTDTAGKEHSHTVPTGTKITIDGKEGKLTDLKKGDEVSVTMEGDKVIEISKGKSQRPDSANGAAEHRSGRTVFTGGLVLVYRDLKYQ